MDIFVQNKALLHKNLHKFYNRHNIPWVNLIWETHYNGDFLPGNSWIGSFWWKANLKLIDNFNLWPDVTLEMAKVLFSGLTYGTQLACRTCSPISSLL